MTTWLAGRALVLLAATCCFVAFATGVRSHFSSRRAMRPGMRLIAALTLLGFLALWLRLMLHPAPDLWWIAVILLVLSFNLFLWSVHSSPRRGLALAFDDDRPDFVLRSGAYAWVRHPFYLAYMVFWLGLGVARLDWLGWLFCAGMSLLYWRAASEEERMFEDSKLAPLYADYREAAGMFLPRLKYPRKLGAAGPWPRG